MVNHFEILDIELAGQYFSQEPPGPEPKLFFPELVHSPIHEIICSFSPKMDMFFFTRTSLNFGESRIFFIKQDKGEWQKPKHLLFEKTTNLSGTTVSHTSEELFINVFEKKETPRMAIYTSKLLEDKWLEPEIITAVNLDGYHSAYPSVTDSGNMYFHSNRTEGLGGVDIYRSEFKNGIYSNPVNIGSPVNSKLNEFHSFIAPDESYIIFDVQGKENNIGNQDLYISFNLNEDGWSEPENLGERINSNTADFRACVTPEGKYILFSSNRKTETTQSGIQNIYWIEADFIKDLKHRHF